MSNNIDNIDENNYDKDLAKSVKAEHDSTVRQRIDELMERKRLKELLDDTDDW